MASRPVSGDPLPHCPSDCPGQWGGVHGFSCGMWRGKDISTVAPRPERRVKDRRNPRRGGCFLLVGLVLLDGAFWTVIALKATGQW